MLSLAILCAALAYFWALTRRQQTLLYLLKPATMLLMLVLASSGLAASPAPGYAWAIVVGLLWSLAGDIFLMLPGDRFIAGLASFFVAHLFYIWGLWRAVPFKFTGLDAATGLALALVAVLGFRRLARGMAQHGRAGEAGAVAAYGVVLSVMVWRALATLAQPAGLPLRAGLVALGGVLFAVSDGILAWHRFVAPVPQRDRLVMGTYFAAQYCLAASVAWPPAAPGP